MSWCEQMVVGDKENEQSEYNVLLTNCVCSLALIMLLKKHNLDFVPLLIQQVELVNHW